MIRTKLIAVTQPVIDEIPGADELIAYCARVSNPANQGNHATADRLLAYCARHGHWSVFEMASVVIEIEAPRDISRQLLRHRSVHFQELSQRYSGDIHFSTDRQLRLQHPTNRQESLPCWDNDWHAEWSGDLRETAEAAEALRRKWQARGIANEVLRVIYPEGLTMSRLYAHATVRDWWHYVRVRAAEGTQAEHRELAEQIDMLMRSAVPGAWRGLIASVAGREGLE
jgi:thymidylate synthase (FAD)